MSEANFIDLSVDSDNPKEPRSWDESYWIRPSQPRRFPNADVPPVVAQRLAFLLSLPPATDELVPPGVLSVTDLLGDWPYCPTPRQSIINAKVYFTNDPCETNPHAVVKAIKNRPTIPPPSVVLELKQSFGQSWFNGSCSIVDSYYKDLPLPLWVLTLWDELNMAHLIRVRWTDAEEFIRLCKHRDPGINLQLRQIADSLMGLLQQVAWNAPLSGFPACGWRPGCDTKPTAHTLSEGTSVSLTSSFIQFFKDGFLDDEAINMMLHFIRLQVQRHPVLASSVVIADLWFTNKLLQEYSKPAPSYSRSPLLVSYEEFFTGLSRKELFFIVNSGGNHWTTIKIDFVHCTIAYGDSLPGVRSPEKATMLAINNWLKLAFPSSSNFSKAANLPCESQTDGWSCGITACTMITSLLGIDEPWTPTTAKLMRMTWANRVMKIHAQTSNPLSAAGTEEAPSVVHIDSDSDSTDMKSIGIDSEGVYAGSSGDEADQDYILSIASYVDTDGVIHFSDSDKEESNHPISAPPKTSKKHERSRSDAVALDTSSKRQAVFKGDNERNYGPIGISRAARSDQATKEALANGTYTTTNAARKALLGRARKHDEKAELDPKDPNGQRIWHSVCGKFIPLDGPNRTSKFVRHVKTCVANGGMRKNGKFTTAAAGTPTIDAMFKNYTKTAVSHRQSSVSVPPMTPTPPPMVTCCGLRPEHDPRVANVCDRGPLGGRKSIHKISQERFNTEYKYLTKAQKDTVQMASSATASWIVHYHPSPHIRHAKCLVECDPSLSKIQPADICFQCAGLLSKREFQTALGREPAPEENLKFVPHDHRNKAAAMLFARFNGLQGIMEQTSTNSPLINFVLKTINGEVANATVFMGLIEAMATKDDKLSRGKGLQNFNRKPAFTEFCQTALIFSPQTYRLIGKHFPVPSERNLRLHRSRVPGFPVGVTDINIQRATEYLARLNYEGPVSISCDDTQLLSKMSPYFNGETNEWYLLGGVGEPIKIVGDAEEVELMIIQAVEKTEKATKCRLWCLQVPLPGVPVFIFAAMAISSTLKAEDLLVAHNQLINGLLDAGICVASYSCDGSATERKLANLFLKSARDSNTTNIPHPRPEFPSIPIVLHRFGPRLTPIVTIQDAKHAAKTARNTLYSGTRSMLLGNCVIHYLQVLMLSNDPRSPLYKRDVVKVDRQDDLAALRLFSSSFLRHVLCVSQEQATKGSSVPLSASSLHQESLPDPGTVFKHDLTGLAVWIFAFGDFFDAFQSRSLGMYDRTIMVLRLRFFLDIWKSSLKTLGYSESQHFISRDSEKIFHNLIHGFLALVLVYRDALDHPNYPFCPWLHSTESCEHTFGEARKCKPDFTFADFIYMIPKLGVVANASAKTADHNADAKARAAGYFHTLYSAHGVDINALSTFPSSSLIHRAAQTAYEEAEALVALCGIPVTPALCPPPPKPQDLANHRSPDAEGSENLRNYVAPSIHEWFHEQEEELSHDDLPDHYMACSFQEPPSRPAVELDVLLRNEETRGCATVQLDDQMAAYAAASVALEIEEHDDMPARDDEQEWDKTRRYMLSISPPVNIRPLVFSDEVNLSALINNGGSDLDLMSLVTAREVHETHFAKKAIRVGSLKPEVSITTVSDDSIDDNSSVSPSTARSILLSKIYSTLRLIDETSGSTTGARRAIHYEGRFDTGATGNAANASTVAKLRGGQVLKMRADAFRCMKLKCAGMVEGAGVTALSPIRTGSFAFVLVDDQLWFAEVLSMYSKGTGKAGKYSWVHEQTNVASVTSALVQLWEQWQHREFRSVVKSTASHHAYRYAHIPSHRLVYVAKSSEKPELYAPERIRLTNSLFGVWNILSAELPGIISVVAELSRRRKNVEGEDDE